MNVHTTSETQKGPQQLEREIDEQRSHLVDTLNELGDKFSPAQIAERAVEYMRSNGGEFSRNLVNVVKLNPVPTLLTAIGLVWMMAAQKRSGSSEYDPGFDENHSPEYGVSSSDRVYSTPDNDNGGGQSKQEQLKGKANAVKSAVSGAAGKAGHTLGDAKDRAAVKGRETTESLRNKGKQVRQAAQRQSRRISQNFEHMLHEQPLAVGAIGIAIGALIGASLPATSAEDRLMGSTRDSAADKAATLAENSYEKAKEKVGAGQQSSV